MRTVTIEAVDGGTFAEWVGGWELALPARSDMLLFEGSGEGSLDAVHPVRPCPVRPVQRGAPGQLGRGRESPGGPVEPSRGDGSSLDLRNNGGGQAEGYRQLLDFLADRERDLSRRSMRPDRPADLLGRRELRRRDGAEDPRGHLRRRGHRRGAELLGRRRHRHASELGPESPGLDDVRGLWHAGRPPAGHRSPTCRWTSPRPTTSRVEIRSWTPPSPRPNVSSAVR